jgi:quercetin dioxygenase-like cupin family protein
MPPTITREDSMSRAVGFVAGVVVGAVAALAGATLLHSGGAVHAQSPGSKVLLDNERVNVVRAITQPGQVEKPHQHEPDENYVSIQLTPGDLEVTVGDQPTIHGSQGSVYWLPSTLTHTVNNRTKAPIEVIVVRLKDPVKK